MKISLQKQNCQSLPSTIQGTEMQNPEGMNLPVFEEVHSAVGQGSFIRFHQDLNETSLKAIHLILF